MIYNIVNKFEYLSKINNFQKKNVLTKINSSRNRKPKQFYNKINFKSKNIVRVEDNNFTVIEESFHQEDIINLTSYTANKKASSDMIKN